MISTGHHQICPLCNGVDTSDFFQNSDRNFLRCQTCLLVFVPPKHFLSVESEKERYDQHQNSPDDLRYRRFLNRIFQPMKGRLKPASFGLDFGSGPGPTLSVMFQEEGHSMAIYDLFYADNPMVFEWEYDFITTTETIEHLRDPKEDLGRLWGCLKPGGILGVMTSFIEESKPFADWYYKNDLTHICFYTKLTFNWLATHWQTTADFVDDNVVFFLKTS